MRFIQVMKPCITTFKWLLKVINMQRAGKGLVDQTTKGTVALPVQMFIQELVSWLGSLWCRGGQYIVIIIYRDIKSP